MAQLHGGPPFGEFLEVVELGEDFQRGDGPDGGETFGVVASQEMGEADELLPVEAVFLLQVGGQVALGRDVLSTGVGERQRTWSTSCPGYPSELQL